MMSAPIMIRGLLGKAESGIIRNSTFSIVRPHSVKVTSIVVPSFDETDKFSKRGLSNSMLLHGCGTRLAAARKL